MTANALTMLHRFAERSTAEGFTADDMYTYVIAQGVADGDARMAVEDWERENGGEPSLNDLERVVVALNLPSDCRRMTPDQLARVAQEMRAAANRGRAAIERFTEATG